MQVSVELTKFKFQDKRVFMVMVQTIDTRPNNNKSHHHHHHHHHHISVMELGHLLTRSSLMYPEVSSKVCHDPFCHFNKSISY